MRGVEDGKQLHGGGAIFFLNGDHNMQALLYAEYHEWQKVTSFMRDRSLADNRKVCQRKHKMLLAVIQ